MITENDGGFKKETANITYIGKNVLGDTSLSASSKEYANLVSAFKKYVDSIRLDTGKVVEGKLELSTQIDCRF